MSTARRNRGLVLICLVVSVVINIVCIALLVVAYKKFNHSCSSNQNAGTCPAVQTYFVSGYDSSIMYNGSLGQTGSTYFMQQTATEVNCITKNIHKAKYTPYQVQISGFRAPPRLSHATAAGALFYGMVALQGSPSKLPSTAALTAALSHSCTASSEHRVKRAATSAYEVFSINTQPSALCQTLYVPANFQPLPQTTVAPSSAPNPTTAAPGSSTKPPVPSTTMSPKQSTGTVAPPASSSATMGPPGSSTTMGPYASSTTTGSTAASPSTTVMPSVTPSQLCALDVIFVLDQNVTQANFQLEKAFAVKVVNQMVNLLGWPVGTSSMQTLQFAGVTFSDHGKVQFTLCQSSDQATVINHIRGLAYSPGMTKNTADALNTTLNKVLIGTACDRSQNPDLVILVTSGINTPGTPDPIPIAQAIRAQINTGVNTQIISVGVTGLNGSNSGNFYQELLGISGNKNQVFNVTNYNGLASIVTSLVNDLGSCSPLPTSPPAGCTPSTQMNDIIFVFDDSTNMGPDDFKAALQLMSQFVQSYTISSTYTQFAVMGFDFIANLEGTLNLFSDPANSTANKIALTKFILQQQQNVYPGQNIYNALQLVQSTVQQPMYGYRSTSNKMLVLISSAPWTVTNPISTAQAMRQSGLNIVAIGYGNHSNSNQLLAQIAGGVNCVMMAQTPSRLTNQTLAWLNSVTCQLQANPTICQ